MKYILFYFPIIMIYLVSTIIVAALAFICFLFNFKKSTFHSVINKCFKTKYFLLFDTILYGLDEW